MRLAWALQQAMPLAWAPAKASRLSDGFPAHRRLRWRAIDRWVNGVDKTIFWRGFALEQHMIYYFQAKIGHILMISALATTWSALIAAQGLLVLTYPLYYRKLRRASCPLTREKPALSHQAATVAGAEADGSVASEQRA